MRRLTTITGLIACSVCAPALAAQDELNRANPRVIDRSTAAPLETDRVDNPRIAVEDYALIPPDSARVMAGAIRVEGATQLPPGAFSAVIESYIGRELESAELKSLTRDIADVARKQGYIFATAWIAPQQLHTGILRVTLDEGRVDEIRIDGKANRQAVRILEGLVSDQPAMQPELERILLLAGDVPGVVLKSSRFDRINGRGVLTVVLEKERFAGRAGIDNRGTSGIGPWRARLGYDFNSLATSGDSLSVQLFAAPVDREFGLAAANYMVPLGYDGAVMTASASYGRSRPGGVLAGFAVRGESVDLSLGASYPLVRSRRASLWLFGEFGFRRIQQSATGTPVRDDSVTALTAGIRGNVRFAGGRFYGGLALTQGINAFGSTRPGELLASRPDADGSFTKVTGWADWSRTIAGPVSIRFSANSQWAASPLLAGEEFGIGGAEIGRGYDYFEVSGDRGISGLAELRANYPGRLPSMFHRLQVYGFVDGGVTDNIGIAGDPIALYSAGGGLRAGLLGQIDLGLEAAFPLNADRFDSGNRDPRLSVSVATAF